MREEYVDTEICRTASSSSSRAHRALEGVVAGPALAPPDVEDTIEEIGGQIVEAHLELVEAAASRWWSSRAMATSCGLG